MLRRAVVDLHDVVQGSLEEGELTEDHCKRTFRASVKTGTGYVSQAGFCLDEGI